MNIEFEKQEVEQLLDQAAERGARQALKSVGLHDEDAAQDLRDIRNLIDAWRAAKRTFWTTAIKAIALACTGAFLAYLAMKFGIGK